MLREGPVLFGGPTVVAAVAPFWLARVCPPPNWITRPMLRLALGRIAPIAAARAALLVLSPPSAWIASGAFCCAMRTASSSEILRALSGARVKPGCRPGLRTWAPASGTTRNKTTIAGSNLIGGNNLCVMDRTPESVENQRAAQEPRPFNNYARPTLYAEVASLSARRRQHPLF